VEGLAQELRAEVAPPHPGRFAAPLEDRGDAGEAGHLVGRAEAAAVGAEGREQP